MRNVIHLKWTGVSAEIAEITICMAKQYYEVVWVNQTSKLEFHLGFCMQNNHLYTLMR